MSVLPVTILKDFASPPGEDLTEDIASLLQKKNAVVVVVDDDPTGAQYADVPILTNWRKSQIETELKTGSQLFFILTNSRSMTVQQAIAVNKEVGENIEQAFKSTGKIPVVISRSDSTLRGHFPDEMMALAEGLGRANFQTALIPAFLEAGRYTLNNIQHVQEGDMLMPVHQTAFAHDKAFGFRAATLPEWIEEKSGGNITQNSVIGVSLEELNGQSGPLIEKLRSIPSNATIVVNAVTRQQLQAFAFAVLQAGVSVLFRTGPSFVAALGGLETKIMKPEEAIYKGFSTGGLIVVGSYVPKSSRQLEALLSKNNVPVALEVQHILNDPNGTYLKACLSQVNELLAATHDVVIYTSRDLIHGNTPEESLKIGNNVSAFLVQLVKGLFLPPRFLIVKGGITSNDIAMKALGIQRALVKGQVQPGVPVWTAGPETLFPGLPFIVFPGNVGNDNSLAELYETLSELPIHSTL